MSGPSIEERVASVRGRVEAACARAGRSPDEVALVAVSKTHPPEAVDAVARCGIQVFGESKVQEARAKIPLCSGRLRWHLVGHLQTNKARLAVQLFEAIHSVDSVRLIEALESECDAAGRTLRIFLQVNVSGEDSKFGCAPEDLPVLLQAASHCRRLETAGLMTIPPWSPEPEKTRVHFRRLREIRDRCGTEWDCPVSGLSMGMSHDFEVAVEEGATFIRIGTELFGERSRT